MKLTTTQWIIFSVILLVVFWLGMESVKRGWFGASVDTTVVDTSSVSATNGASRTAPWSGTPKRMY